MQTPRLATIAATAVIAAGVLVSGCGRSTKVESGWEPALVGSGPYNNILIVGVTESSRQRRRFENTLAKKLERDGVNIWASNQVMPENEELNRDTVAAAVKERAAAIVIVTQLVNAEVSTKEVPERTEIKTNRKRGGSVIDFVRYDYDEYEESAYIEVRSTVSLLTDVYETDNGKLIYQMKTTAFDKETDFEILDEVTSAIVKRLRDDRVTR
jgi:hypothetical protein